MLFDRVRDYALRAWSVWPKWFRWAFVATLLVLANAHRPHEIGFRQTVLLLVLEAFVIVWTGAKHAYHYSQRTRAHYEPLGRIGWVARNFENHLTQMWGEYVLFALLWFIGVPAFAILGAQFVARIPFQGLINWSTGAAFVDAGEAPHWYVRGAKRWKVLPGTWSLAKIPIGCVLIYLGFVL